MTSKDERDQNASLRMLSERMENQRIDVQCRKCASHLEVPPGPWVDRDGKEHPGGLLFEKEAGNYPRRAIKEFDPDNSFLALGLESGTAKPSKSGNVDHFVIAPRRGPKTLWVQEYKGRWRFMFKCRIKQCGNHPNLLESEFTQRVMAAIVTSPGDVVIIKV